MLVEFTIAGYEASWEFGGSRSINAWAQNRPWLRQGGMCVLKTSGAASEVELYGSLERLLRAHHGDQGSLDIIKAECDSASPPFVALLGAIGLDVSLTPSAARAALSEYLVDRSAIIVMRERGEVTLGVWEKFVATHDFLVKGNPQVRLQVIVLDHRSAVQSEPSFDFTAGRLASQLLSASDGRERDLWSAYLHHRANWEGAGQFSKAVLLGEELQKADAGDDDRVERLLNEFAGTTVDGLSDASATLRGVVDALSSRGNAYSAQRAALQSDGLLWRPFGQQRLEPVPWVARELLRRGLAGASIVGRLRHSLVCAPVASEILVHCLSAESAIRMHQHDRLPEPGAEVCALLESFQTGRSDFVLYPVAHPSRPVRKRDAWAFASLGTVLKASSPPAPQSFWRVLHLRNAVAHGHYVGWAHVKQAWEQHRLIQS